MISAMLLLDTHLLLWAAFSPDKLSPGAREILQWRETPLAFSLVTLCEVAIQTSLARPDFLVDPQRLQRALLQRGLLKCPSRQPRSCGSQHCPGFTAIRLTGCWWRRPLKTA